MLQLILWNDEMKSEMKRWKQFPSLNMCQAKSEEWRVRWRDENFFPGPNIHQAKSGVKKNSLCKKKSNKTTYIHPSIHTDTIVSR